MRWLTLLVLLIGCPQEGTNVAVMLNGDLPTDSVVAITVVDPLGRVIAATGDTMEPMSVPEGDQRVARAVVSGVSGDVVHGTSAPFDVDGDDVEVTIDLRPAPTGSIVSIPERTGSATVTLTLEGTDWDSIELGPASGEVTQTVVREGEEMSVSVDHVLDTRCLITDGCTRLVYVTFVADSGARSKTEVAEIVLDALPPTVDRLRLAYASQLAEADRLGGGSLLKLAVRASEPVDEMRLLLASASGDCPETLEGGCTGAGRDFTCTATAPPSVCGGRFTLQVALRDIAGLEALWSQGSTIQVDTQPPSIEALDVECAGPVLVAFGQTDDGVAVQLLSGPSVLATAPVAFDGGFVVTASGADTLRVLDGGANTAAQNVDCN